MVERILVTGGAGFIGSHLVENLLASGHSVTVLDDLSSGHEGNLEGFDVRFVRGSLLDRDALRGALDGVGGVLHHAAIPSVPGSVADPVGALDANVMGTAMLLDECRQASIRRMVFASSSAVYGEPERTPLQEDDRTRPLSPYGVHKLTSEHLCRVASLTGGPDTVSFRYFNVFGPRQRADSDYAAAIPIFIARCVRGERPTIFGDGSQTRDFVHVRDIAEANRLLLEAEAPWGGEVFNLGNGEAMTIADLARSIMAAYDVDGDPIFAPPRPGDILHSVANASKLWRALDDRGIDWRPATAFADALRDPALSP